MAPHRGEIRTLARRAHIDYPEPNQTRLQLGADRYAMGLSTDRGVRLQGYHSEHLLLIVDEATGIPLELWEAIEGMRAGGQVHVLALGNPLVIGGPFYSAFTSAATQWRTFTISAFDTPNLRGLSLDDLLALDESELDRNERPYLITRRWVRDRWFEWGRHDVPDWQSRVMGEFPSEVNESLLPGSALSGWRERPASDDGRSAVQIGIDVAGAGSAETVIAVVQGGALLNLEAWTDADPMPRVTRFLDPLRARIQSLNVDAIGVGYHFGLELARRGFDTTLVNVGAVAHQPERFQNLKAELYWHVRELAIGGSLSGLSDEWTYEQLASLRYEHTPGGRVAIESKDAMRARGLRSPDRAEAIMLAYAPLAAPRDEYVEYIDEVHISPV